MRIKKKLFSVTSAIFILVGGFTSVHAATNDNNWAIPNDVLPGTHSVLFQDAGSGEKYSALLLESAMNDRTKDPTCADAYYSACASNPFQWSALIPQCSNASDINCISDFGAIKSDGTKVSGVFSNYFPLKAQNAFSGAPGNGLPSGTTGSLYTIPGISHEGGDKFYVSAFMRGGSWGNVSPGASTSDAQLDNFSAQITPVDLVKVPQVGTSCGLQACPNSGYAKIRDSSGGYFWGGQSPGWDGVHNCIATSTADSMCAQKYGFPTDTRFFLEIRVNNLPYGWLHGRLADPKINVTVKDLGRIQRGIENTLYFEGAPAQTPVVYKSYKWADMPEALKSKYDEMSGNFIAGSSGGYSRIPTPGTVTDPLIRNYTSAPLPSGRASIEELKAWLPYIGDKATASPSDWSVRSLSANEIKDHQECYGDRTKIAGIVTTNSTVYSPGPPTYNKSEGSLDYQVGAPHYTSSGDVFKGNYDLIMSSSVARCIYGFSSAPIKATISVTSADGSPQIATTVVSESDGWIHMRAANFEFSAPTVKVKLSQEGSKTILVKTAPKKITCVKGKVSKVFATATCPAGYRKK